MILFVKVSPGASKNSIEGFFEGILKVKIQAPPEQGRANDALVSFLAEVLSLPRRQIEILSGQTSRLKKLKIEGIEENDFLAFLEGKK